MKAPIFWLALALSTGPLLAAELQPGASLAEVRATLGTPRGQVQANGRQVLYYERGEVELQNGALVRVALRSPEEHAILTAREERLRDEREARRVKLEAEGNALRETKLADASFKAAPAAYQVAFWEDFARRYPEVPAAEPLAIARLRFNEQVEEKRRQDYEAKRLAEIEERIAAAAQRAASPIRYYSGYGRRHYRSAGLGPITYTFFDSPLPPYVTPSGNPAGNLTGPIDHLSPRNPVVHGGRGGDDRNRSGHWTRGDRGDGQGYGRGEAARRNRRM